MKKFFYDNPDDSEALASDTRKKYDFDRCG